MGGSTGDGGVPARRPEFTITQRAVPWIGNKVTSPGNLNDWPLVTVSTMNAHYQWGHKYI
jgi:hypothetical protein